MMYLPTEQEKKDMKEIEKWIIIKGGYPCLREDTPDYIRHRRAEIAKKMSRMMMTSKAHFGSLTDPEHSWYGMWSEVAT